MNTETTAQMSEGELLQILTGLRMRTDAANAQLVQLGLLVEYLYEQLSAQGVDIPMDNFPNWAQARYAEIQKQAEEAQKQGLMDDFAKSTEEAIKGIDLEDSK